MLSIKANAGKIAYGVQSFTLDTPDDIPTLNKKTKDCEPGSTAFVISTSKKYMLNSQGQWIEIKTISNGSGNDSDSEPDPNNTYIYDGGII